MTLFNFFKGCILAATVVPLVGCSTLMPKHNASEHGQQLADASREYRSVTAEMAAIGGIIGFAIAKSAGKDAKQTAAFTAAGAGAGGFLGHKVDQEKEQVAMEQQSLDEFRIHLNESVVKLREMNAIAAEMTLAQTAQLKALKNTSQVKQGQLNKSEEVLSQLDADSRILASAKDQVVNEKKEITSTLKGLSEKFGIKELKDIRKMVAEYDSELELLEKEYLAMDRLKASAQVKGEGDS